MVHEVAESLQTQIAEKRIVIALDIPRGLPRLKADQLRFSQVITNLLSNACKYSPADSTVTVTARKDAGVVQIAVSDTGIGIREADRSRLFTKFFRADTSLTREVSGTGLGLYITKHLVEAHGGKIWVENKEEEGSTFCFTLPRADLDDLQQHTLNWDGS